MTGLPTLSGPEMPPAAGGAPRQLVILLHGYGADGQDLLGLAQHWGRLLPQASFVAPNAPFPCEMSPYGHQWFSFEDRDPAMLYAATEAATGILDAYIDGELDRRGLGDAQLALVGFSQGAMIALHAAPRRARPVAAVIGFSGALVGPEHLPGAVRSRPPFLLVHGDADPVVPFVEMSLAAAAMRQIGLTVRIETRRGLAHGIDEAGLVIGGRFLAQAFTASASMLQPEPGPMAGT